ncbi:hypothetical protein J6590_097162 [Homalodisca vitripennis]|nr:hypothetical protein J6590_097162 [Homalodisca vitripennis]
MTTCINYGKRLAQVANDTSTVREIAFFPQDLATPPAPSPPPSHTPRPLLDPLRRPPSQWESSKPPTLRERWRTSDGGRAMADGVMADEQKFVSPAAGIRTRAPTNARLSR